MTEVIGKDGTTLLIDSGQEGKELWLIRVMTWGSVFFWGTEEEAEAWRRHKARWEHSIAVKIKLDKEAIFKTFTNYYDPHDEYQKDLAAITRCRELVKAWDDHPKRDTSHNLEYFYYLLHCLRGRVKRVYKRIYGG